MSIKFWPPLAAAVLIAAAPAYAGPLTFADALQRAVAFAPSLRAVNLETQAARAESRAAGALPDPKLGLSLENVPVSGPNAGRLGADEMTMARVGVIQDMPNRARRQAAVASARAGISEAEARALAEARRVRIETAVAWIDLAYAQRRLEALDLVLAKLKPLWDAQPAAVAAGRARPGQALTPVQMQTALEDQRSELLAQLGRARATVTRWTGEPAPTAAGAAPHYDVDEAALRASIDGHPALLAAEATVGRAKATIAEARAAKRPDWSWEVAYGRRDPMFGDMVSAGVTISLPIFAGSRQDPIIAARRADAARAEAAREDARRALEAQLEADLADHAMHHDQWFRARTIAVPAAQQRADLETESYAAGSATLADVLDALGALADAKLAVLEREALVMRDGARIALTYGDGQ
jgi:outer membrane protein TolC